MRGRAFGRIGVVTSIGGKLSAPHLLAYNAAKAGAVGYSEGLNVELAGTGVTCTTVVPGLMRTGSHLHAEFVGDAPHEYGWFAPGASLPLVSMDAERAAERIVRGVLRGRSHVVLTPVAKAAMRLNGVAPATTNRLLSLVARALPEGDGVPDAPIDGSTARRRLASNVVERLTRLGTRAAGRFNQLPPGAREPSPPTKEPT